VSVVRFKFRCNILISGKIIKEIPGLVASGTPYIYIPKITQCVWKIEEILKVKTSFKKLIYYSENNGLRPQE